MVDVDELMMMVVDGGVTIMMKILTEPEATTHVRQPLIQPSI